MSAGALAFWWCCCGEGEQLIPAALIDQFDVGCTHTLVAVQRLLVHRPGCPGFLQDLW